MKIGMKVVLPPGLLFDTNKLTRAVENALDGAAKAVLVDFQTTVATWSHKPAFEIEKGKGSRNVGTDDPQYGYVNDGTSVRYALMSADFKAKTQPGFIGSSGGAGHVIVIDRNHPRPGIKARKFDEAIGKKWEEKLPDILQRALDSEVD